MLWSGILIIIAQRRGEEARCVEEMSLWRSCDSISPHIMTHKDRLDQSLILSHVTREDEQVKDMVHSWDMKQDLTLDQTTAQSSSRVFNSSETKFYKASKRKD